MIKKKKKARKQSGNIEVPLEGKDIVEHMRREADVHEATWRHFYWKCELWRAIRNHIVLAPQCVLIDREGELTPLLVRPGRSLPGGGPVRDEPGRGGGLFLA